MIASESMHSIIHTLALHNEDNDTIVINSEPNSHKEEKATHEEKQDNIVYILSSESSGYATEDSFLSESLVSKMSSYINSISLEGFRSESQEKVDEESTESIFVLPTNDLGNCSLSSPRNLESSCLETNNQPSLHRPTKEENLCNQRYTLEARHELEEINCVVVSPQDYIIPVLQTHISFNFPPDMVL